MFRICLVRVFIHFKLYVLGLVINTNKLFMKYSGTSSYGAPRKLSPSCTNIEVLSVWHAVWVSDSIDLILHAPSTIFQLNRDGSSWVEPVLS